MPDRSRAKFYQQSNVMIYYINTLFNLLDWIPSSLF